MWLRYFGIRRTQKEAQISVLRVKSASKKESEGESRGAGVSFLSVVRSFMADLLAVRLAGETVSACVFRGMGG